MPDPNSLATLLNMPSYTNMGARPQPEPNIDRGVRADLLMKFLGLQEDPTDVTPQTELESAYQQVQAENAAAEQRKAEMASYPQQVTGEYNLKAENLKGQYGLQTEAAKAHAVEQAKQEGVAAQEKMNQDRIAAANERAAASQAGTTNRTGMIQQGAAQRQQVGEREARAKLLDAGKVAPTYPPVNGAGDALDYLKGFVGIGPYGRANASAAEAASLRAQNSANPAPAPGVEEVANYYRTKFPGLTGQQLASQILKDQPNATPEAIQAVFDALGR